MLEKLRSKLDIKKLIAFLRKRILYVVGLLLVIAIITAVGIVYAKNPKFFEELEGYGYAGIFVISVVLNATIIIPISVMAIVSSMGALLPSPLLVGIIAGVGAGIGEMTGYLAGRAGRGLLAKSTVYTRIEKWVKRWGWIAVFLLSVFPFVFDVVGIIAGAMRMPWWRFWLACWAGRTVSYVTVAYLGSVILTLIPWFN
ncbi:MAG: DedA family protein [Dehalococcoidales bacterium]|nr:DedA family protein [Dehalococcoidales bacterium]